MFCGLTRIRRLLPPLLCLLLAAAEVRAGGSKWVAGVSYFDSSVLGQPLTWQNGALRYFVDQGPLNSSVSHTQAVTMVDEAAALWSAVPTAAVSLVDAGTLNEDVSAANVAVSSGVFTAPADVVSSATSTPVAVIFDADGSVIDALYGSGASEPTSCQNNAVFVWMDNYTTTAHILHGGILLNGRCAATDAQLRMMRFFIERAFGRLLGLDYAQYNFQTQDNGTANSDDGPPVMQPFSGNCANSGGDCIPDPFALSYDDVAALNRLYPVSSANQSQYPAKQFTAANTVSISGTISFRAGLGMQGVNVVARPLDASGNPLDQYAVTAVSGVRFNGNHGNPISGYEDSNGIRLDRWGSNDATLQGSFDLSGIPLPPGVASASYLLTFEAINPMEIQANSVGPYLQGSPSLSGTFTPIQTAALPAGSAKTLTVKPADSATGGGESALGSQSAPQPLPVSGIWYNRFSQVGQTDWLSFPVRGQHTFTLITQALDESGQPTDVKAVPSIGVWDAFDPASMKPVGVAPGMNGLATGETWLRVTASADDVVLMAIADQRGDGRPDYAYSGWVLYADTVEPARLPTSGGAIVIHGTGFRLTDTVQVGGQQALVTSISPTEITAIAPPAATGTLGSVDVEVDELASFYALTIITNGLSYDAGQGDSLNLVTAPQNTVPLHVPLPFTVSALGPDLNPAGGVTVIYTVTKGTAVLGCGLQACSVSSSGDGRATMNVTAVDGTISVVTASLINGASLQAHFSGGTVPTISALTPELWLAAGSTELWPVQVLVQQNGAPASGQAVSWQISTSGINAQGTASAVTNASGVAAQMLNVGPLTEGQTASIAACVNGTTQCVTFNAFGARPEYGWLQAISGTAQTLQATDTPSAIELRLLDMDGNEMAGGLVTLYQSLYAWAPACLPLGRCPEAQLLATQVSVAASGLDGAVSFTPLTLPGTATRLVALAVTGDTASLEIHLEQLP